MTRRRQINWTSCTVGDPFGREVLLTGFCRHHICLLLLDGELFLAPIPKQPMVRLDRDKDTIMWALR
jgi:hypothetical protein